MIACAAAIDGQLLDEARPALPGGSSLLIAASGASRLGGHGGLGEVVKDAGDDPDVTHGARIRAVAGPAGSPGLHLSGGAGVGRATKPGLALEVGQWAINPVPRRMLEENLGPFLAKMGGEGLSVKLEIADGERLAQKTMNPRLGIVGGLSILGTTGLVKPFSHGAYVAAIDSAMRVARAAGAAEAVLATGGRSEALARRDRPDLPEGSFIQIADFFRAGLRLAAHHGFKSIGLAEFFGKAIKQAQGLPYTHAHHGDLSLAPLADLAAGLGLDPETAGLIGSAPTAMAALEVLRAAGALSLAEPVARRALAAARRFAGGGPRLWVRIYDFDGSLLAQASD
jgi:cobalt-precorrin-5B (C1)-methyltransferase